jgi:hypothetical protein
MQPRRNETLRTVRRPFGRAGQQLNQILLSCWFDFEYVYQDVSG